MSGWPVLLAAALLLSSGCSLLKLDKEMQQARQELLLIPGQLQVSDSGRSALVALLDADSKLIAYRIAAPGETFYFTAAPATYQLLGFDDRNGNFILDNDEPRHWLSKAQSAPP